MDMDLDEQLAAGAPAGHQRTPALLAELVQLIDDTERVVSQRRRRRLVRVGAAAFSVALLGGAGAAAAAGALGWDRGGWWDDPEATTHQITSESGHDCSVTYAPRAQHDPSHPVSAEDRAAATAAATEFLRRFDYAVLDGLPANAAFVELNARLTQALSRQGLSTFAVGVALATDCETGTEQ